MNASWHARAGGSQCTTTSLQTLLLLLPPPPPPVQVRYHDFECFKGIQCTQHVIRVAKCLQDAAVDERDQSSQQGLLVQSGRQLS